MSTDNKTIKQETKSVDSTTETVKLDETSLNLLGDIPDNLTFDKEYNVDKKKVFDLLIKNVYTNVEVFLREIISNGSDACTKVLRLRDSLLNEGFSVTSYSDLRIDISSKPELNKLIVSDTGIGMTREHLVDYLGNIANSGTGKFKEILAREQKGENISDLIGQFGLGFYSLFLVADRVDVVTKHPKDTAYLWSSDGQNGYSIEEFKGKFPYHHGTIIYISLKDDAKEYLKTDRIISIIKTYSMCIGFPINVLTEKKVEEEVPVEDEEEKVETTADESKVEEIEDGEDIKKDEDGEVKVEEVKEKKTKKVSKIVQEMQTINFETEIWNKKLTDETKADFQSFYKSMSNDYEDYAKAETFNFAGVVDIKITMFIPKKNKQNFFQAPSVTADTIAIYNSNVLITKNVSREIFPSWMDFVYVAVSSPDLKINISREFLQGKQALNVLKAKLPQCVAKMFTDAKLQNKELFDSLFKEYQRNIKMAIRETTDKTQKEFTKLLVFPTNQSSDELVSFDEYCSKIPEESKQILYLTGITLNEVKSSLFLEPFKDRIVLLMGDPSDEIMLQSLKEYNGLKLQNISAEGVEDIKSSSESDDDEEYKPFVSFVQENLSDYVEKVVVSKRFETVPASILSGKYGHSGTMEHLLRASAQGSENNMMLQMMLKAKKIFEINSENAFIKQIKALFDKDEKEEAAKLIKFLFQTISFGCGYTIDDKTSYVRSLFEVIASKKE